MALEILHTDADGDRLTAYTAHDGELSLGILSDSGEVYIPAGAVEVLKAELAQPGRFAELQRRSRKLAALENAGVDNWEGYSDALSALGNAAEE